MNPGENDNRDLTEELGQSFHGVLSGARTLACAVVAPARAIGGTDDGANDGDRAARATDHGSAPGGEQLLSPKERILALLAENDGRMEQSEIVRSVAWSESTVSRKLGKLEAEGSISRYRIGRGKLVFLPGTEPDCMGSSLEEGDEEQEERERRPLAA